MTSVNPGQPTPYTLGYEMSPKPTPIAYKHSAEAAGQPAPQTDSAAPRAPMTAEQRGQLSAHRNIMNQPQPDAATSSQLKELNQENQELRARMFKLSENVAPKIQTLNLQIEDLTAKLSAKEQNIGKTSPAMVTGPQSVGTDGQNVVPSDNSSKPDTVATQPNQPPSLSQVVQEQSLFQKQVMDFFTRLTMALDALQGKIEQVMQSISGKDAAKTEVATDGMGTEGAPVSDAVKTDTSPSTPTDQSTAPYKTLESDDTQSTASSTPVQTDASTMADKSSASSTQIIEQLKQQNKLMLEAIEAQEKALNDTILALQMKVEEMTQQLSAQTK